MLVLRAFASHVSRLCTEYDVNRRISFFTHDPVSPLVRGGPVDSCRTLANRNSSPPQNDLDMFSCLFGRGGSQTSPLTCQVDGRHERRAGTRLALGGWVNMTGHFCIEEGHLQSQRVKDSCLTHVFLQAFVRHMACPKSQGQDLCEF